MKRNSAKLLAVLTVGLVMLGGLSILTPGSDSAGDVFLPRALAQAPAEGEKKHGPPETLGDYWSMMGVTKWPLLGSMIWVTSLVIELLIRGRVKGLCPPETVAQLSSIIAVKDYVKAWQYCIDNPSPLSRAMSPAIEKIPQGATASADAAMDYMNLQNSLFKIKCGYLNLNATVNTLLGLFGTISGMISAFNKMAYSGATGDPAKLAGSIGEALSCTWVGLGIAILSLYLYYIMTNRTKTAMTGMQNIVTRLIGQIDFASVSPDTEIITAEMKARAIAGGKGGGAAAAAVPAAAPIQAPKAPKAAKSAEMVQCPHCQAQIQVGAAKCPSCNSELEWE